jgi:hypothetical protein
LKADASVLNQELALQKIQLANDTVFKWRSGAGGHSRGKPSDVPDIKISPYPPSSWGNLSLFCVSQEDAWGTTHFLKITASLLFLFRFGRR